MSNERKLRNIALIGFMGTGKSSVGRLIADQLQFQFVDTDELIERRAGKIIARIFSEDGEPVFRQLERETLLGLAKLEKAVISTGGGLGANADNIRSLKEHSLVVCLWASPERIWDRVGSQTHRPLLREADPMAKIRSLLAAREPFYKQADVLLNTELRGLREVAQQAMHHFQAHLKP